MKKLLPNSDGHIIRNCLGNTIVLCGQVTGLSCANGRTVAKHVCGLRLRLRLRLAKAYGVTPGLTLRYALSRSLFLGRYPILPVVIVTKHYRF